MKRWPSAKVTGGGSGFTGDSPLERSQRSQPYACAPESRLTDSVRQPAVEERLIRSAAVREAQVALALKRLERVHEHRLAAALPAQREKGVERGERAGINLPVRHEVGIIMTVAVERRQHTLQKRRRNRRPHVDPGIEQLRGDGRGALRHLIETGAQPVESLVDRRGVLARELTHRARVAVRSRNRLGDSK